MILPKKPVVSTSRFKDKKFNVQKHIIFSNTFYFLYLNSMNISFVNIQPLKTRITLNTQGTIMLEAVNVHQVPSKATESLN